jgi:uncharacterized repeat protein (TIGR01451 family)
VAHRKAVCLGTLAGQMSYILTPKDSAFQWRCGDSVLLKNLVLTWGVSEVQCDCTCASECSGCPDPCAPQCGPPCHTSSKCRIFPDFTVKTPLVANFTSNSPECFSGNRIDFTALASGGSGVYSYSWSFGDGGISTETSPIHSYSSPGTYTAALTIRDTSTGCTASHTADITIFSNPVASFTSNAPVCQGSEVQFTDTSTPGAPNGGPIVSRTWDFGDIGSNEEPLALGIDIDPNHIYTNPGVYTVTLTVTDSHGCQSSSQGSVTVYATPEAAFELSDSCYDHATFVDKSTYDDQYGAPIQSWSWDFGDGSTGTGQTVVHAYGPPINFPYSTWVRLDVEDEHGCRAEALRQVMLADCNIPEILDVIVSDDQPCEGDMVTITANVRDDVAVEAVYLNYALMPGGSQVHQMYPTSGGGNFSIKEGSWQADLAYPAGTTAISLQVIALDTFGNEATFQLTNKTIIWNDCTSPVVEDVSLSTNTPCTSDDAVVEAHITDNLGVSSATLIYGNVDHQMSLISGKGSPPTDTYWTFTIAHTDEMPGDVREFAVLSMDASGRQSNERVGTISWRDCSAPSMLIISPLEGCGLPDGQGLELLVRVSDDSGIETVTLSYDGENYTQEGKGSTEMEFTWTVPAHQAKTSTVLTLTAKDNSGNTAIAFSAAKWLDCSAPIIGRIVVSTGTPCEKQDVTVMAEVSDNVGLESVTLSYVDHGESHDVPMHLAGGLWTGIITGRSQGAISYTVTAKDLSGKSTTSLPGAISWIECDIPVINPVVISTLTPCAGKDVVVTARVIDSTDGDTEEVALFYDGSDHPMRLISGDKYDGTYEGIIAGYGRGPGAFLTFKINVYDDDSPISFSAGPFTAVWQDCNPSVIEVIPGTSDICIGGGQEITAHVVGPEDMARVKLYYRDSSGFYVADMVRVSGSPRDGDWAYTLKDGKDGSRTSYYVLASDLAGGMARSPRVGAYELSWRLCNGRLNLKKESSTKVVSPGGTITYTITYWNSGSYDLDDVVIIESYPPGVAFISASPPPDSGTNNRWTIGTLKKLSSATITLTLRAPDALNILFNMEQSTRGLGFVRSSKDLSTSLQPYTLRNQVRITGRGMEPADATSDVTVSGDHGTDARLRESGCGTYSKDERLNYYRENKSIRDVSNLSARYKPTSFFLPQNRSVNYESTWTEIAAAKNRLTSESIEESYLYSREIERDGDLWLDRNGTRMAVKSKFQGTRHAGYIDESGPDSKGHRSTIKELASDYSGSFQVEERLGTFHQNRSTGIFNLTYHDEPHLTIYQLGSADYRDETLLNWTVSVVNDGNRALGPIRLMDIFPQGSRYFSASTRPEEPEASRLEDAAYANWTFTYLPVGGALTIYLRTNMLIALDMPVNQVYVEGGYDGHWITARNATGLQASFLSCTPEGICSDIRFGWHPPDWGFKSQKSICSSCLASTPE